MVTTSSRVHHYAIYRATGIAFLDLQSAPMPVDFMTSSGSQLRSSREGPVLCLCREKCYNSGNGSYVSRATRWRHTKPQRKNGRHCQANSNRLSGKHLRTSQRLAGTAITSTSHGFADSEETRIAREIQTGRTGHMESNYSSFDRHAMHGRTSQIDLEGVCVFSSPGIGSTALVLSNGISNCQPTKARGSRRLRADEPRHCQ